MPDQPEQTRRVPDQEIATAYAAARDILSELMGYASSRLYVEKHRPDPDPAAIEEWRRRGEEWASRWHDLRVDDIAAIQRVLDEDAPVLRSLPPVEYP